MAGSTPISFPRKKLKGTSLDEDARRRSRVDLYRLTKTLIRVPIWNVRVSSHNSRSIEAARESGDKIREELLSRDVAAFTRQFQNPFVERTPDELDSDTDALMPWRPMSYPVEGVIVEDVAEGSDEEGDQNGDDQGGKDRNGPRSVEEREDIVRKLREDVTDHTLGLGFATLEADMIDEIHGAAVDDKDSVIIELLAGQGRLAATESFWESAGEPEGQTPYVYVVVYRRSILKDSDALFDIVQGTNANAVETRATTILDLFDFLWGSAGDLTDEDALHKARSLAAQVEGFHKDGTQMVKGLLGLTTGKLRDMFVQHLKNSYIGSGVLLSNEDLLARRFASNGLISVMFDFAAVAGDYACVLETALGDSASLLGAVRAKKTGWTPSPSANTLRIVLLAATVEITFDDDYGAKVHYERLQDRVKEAASTAAAFGRVRAKAKPKPGTDAPPTTKAELDEEARHEFGTNFTTDSPVLTALAGHRAGHAESWGAFYESGKMKWRIPFLASQKEQANGHANFVLSYIVEKLFRAKNRNYKGSKNANPTLQERFQTASIVLPSSIEPLRRALFPAPPIVIYTALNALNAGNKSLTWHELCGDKFPGRIFDSLVELKLPLALKDHAYFTDLISLWPDVNTATHWDDIAVPAGPRAAAVAGAAATTAAAKETVGSKRRRGGSPVKRRAGGPSVPVKATVVKSAEYVDDEDDGEEHDELDEGLEPPPAKKQKAKVAVVTLDEGGDDEIESGDDMDDMDESRDDSKKVKEDTGVAPKNKLPAAPSTTSSSPLKVNVPASSARTATACITLDDDDDDEVERAAALWPRPDGVEDGETDIGLTATRLFSYILGGQVLSSETLDAIAKDVQAPDAGLDMSNVMRAVEAAGRALAIHWTPDDFVRAYRIKQDKDAITVTGENDKPAAAVRGKKDAADDDAAMYDEYLAAMDDDLTDLPDESETGEQPAAEQGVGDSVDAQGLGDDPDAGTNDETIEMQEDAEEPILSVTAAGSTSAKSATAGPVTEGRSGSVVKKSRTVDDIFGPSIGSRKPRAAAVAAKGKMSPAKSAAAQPAPKKAVNPFANARIVDNDAEFRALQQEARKRMTARQNGEKK
ncbi:hypothetical protein Rhopal_006760-T1 [Rhodotorula paludigena]|uniref:Uncharacterized protein n=1 Tax=Rhodotorula paludigena TaxID=86838 RepID=A0AAV5GTZ8_9BASI|nr:hypothetical protein Rhopal_006760-T1 [Rhodotorula paludigena]